MLVCAFLVAFFPILSNTALGLASADHNLIDCSSFTALAAAAIHLVRLPPALPYFLGGLRIGGGLALIGAIVAEIVAGSPRLGRQVSRTETSNPVSASTSPVCSPRCC